MLVQIAEKRQVGGWNLLPATPSRYFFHPVAPITLLMDGRKKGKAQDNQLSGGILMHRRTGCGSNQFESERGKYNPLLYPLVSFLFCFFFVFLFFLCGSLRGGKKNCVLPLSGGEDFLPNKLTQLSGTKDQTDLKLLSNQIYLAIVALFFFLKTTACDSPPRQPLPT